MVHRGDKDPSAVSVSCFTPIENHVSEHVESKSFSAAPFSSVSVDINPECFQDVYYISQQQQQQQK
jgi:hypothetical protein